MHYDEKTDMIQIFFDGKWKDWKSANLQTYWLFKDGEYLNGATGIQASNNIPSTLISASHIRTTPSVTMEGNRIKAVVSQSGTNNAGQYTGSLFLLQSVNFSALGATRLVINCTTSGDTNNYDFRTCMANSRENNFSAQSLTMHPANKTEEYSIPINSGYPNFAITLGMWHYNTQTNSATLYINSIRLEFD